MRGSEEVMDLFLIGSVGSIILSVGKFYFDSDSGMYFGLAIIMAASLWNTWPRRSSEKQACPACEPSKDFNKL